ncbi:hypothetical protein UAS_00559 [Enterococcus asini ATCC 700915]|uniref:HTH cro/C1-type domain-containing protein n=1 Tax=Enterococcus asini ATCC 700915 TaxID=1158606 RepID=R2S1Y9_9ENTE|nr:helix-turn-helix transcriptional regulator [Enterococcus asini]EOH89445.1 hypothetical protein UAS_00559 [Enterococcus asini ATCC 700915]EOT56536.1 hypothetical protein I579_00035 [Enterococcus asini ATCC 700915]OJG09375.1 hypothetical protein RU94_GL001207 [Enterococcus asini]
MKNNEPDKYEVGKRIRSLRTKNGLTLEEFGLIFDPPASKSIVSRWESGKSLPSPERIKTISDEFSISTIYLLYGTITMEDSRFIDNYKYLTDPSYSWSKKDYPKVKEFIKNSSIEALQEDLMNLDLNSLTFSQIAYLETALAPIDSQDYKDDDFTLLNGLMHHLENLYSYSLYVDMNKKINKNLENQQKIKSKQELQDDARKQLEKILKKIM